MATKQSGTNLMNGTPEYTCPTCGAAYFSKEVADECDMAHVVGSR